MTAPSRGPNPDSPAEEPTPAASVESPEGSDDPASAVPEPTVPEPTAPGDATTAEVGTPEAPVEGAADGVGSEDGGTASVGSPESPDGHPGDPSEDPVTDLPDTTDVPDPAATSTAVTGEADEPGQPEGTEATGSAAAGADDAPVAPDGAEGAATVPLSETEAELAAQRETLARIEARKAAKSGPIESGSRLSGKAADLLAAVRAVESGEKADSVFFDAPAPERPAPSVTGRPTTPAPERPTVPAPGAPVSVALVREVLAAGGAPDALAVQVADVLGEQAADILREDPWQLLSVPGVRPEQADGFARALLGGGCGPDDERRTAALITWRLESAARQGHTALDSAAVRSALAERSVPDPDEALLRAVADGVVLLFQDGAEDAAEAADGAPDDATEDAAEAEREATPPPVPVLLGLDRYALAEESLADGLARLAKAGADDRWAGAEPTELTRAVAASGLVTHTGGEAASAEPVALAETAGGLGLRAVVAVHSECGGPASGPAVVTVAALLAGTQGPGRDPEGALALDLLVVLDAPQLDVESAAMLVESMPDGSRLVLSGDPGRLGSAGAGRVFEDLLAAKVCPRIVSRTPDPGPIGELVSGIGIGELNAVDAPRKEVVIVPVRDAGEAVHRTVQLVADSVPRAIGVPPEQTQVITVGHGGSAGTRALNAALKQRLNPGPGRFGGFDPGDRVAYTPAPGRTVPGTVVSADAEGLRLDCAGGAGVTVPKDRVESAVRHGWALTAHQAVGMRWPAAVVVLPGDAAGGLNRPWVYTAFGRGERHLSVVHGVDQALPRAVTEIPAPERTTRLRPLLEGLLAPTP
ncbi:helix-hairpin-helix domain-containing protein [Streptomyces sp. NPDC020965]|uniref:helix-hairpin-helix domain-containing protein n=1 Tax=Streptomyces sp. NPDC020965 TaxID=3365105 RepID=UPI0037A9A785